MSSPKRSSRRKQSELKGFEAPTKTDFGGRPLGKRGRRLASNPKTARPIVAKDFMHVVLRPTLGQGRHSLLFKAREIEETLIAQGVRFGVQVTDLANASDHLHFVAKARTRRAFIQFLRSSTALIARIVLGAQRNSPKLHARLNHFWNGRPFTRVVKWGRDLRGVQNYLMVNRLELTGMDRPSIRHMLTEIARFTRECKLVPLGFASG